MKKILPFLFLCLAAAGLILILNSCNDDSGDSPNPANGAGGSLARFAITGNTLYLVSKESLEVYDITSGGNPVKAAKRQMGFGIETIYPYGKNLFIGANDGLYIYNNVNPTNPVYMAKYEHIVSCDPVVVQGNYAYVTLRGGSTCRFGSVSSLDVVDISDPTAPKAVSSQRLDSPYGLGVNGKKLFVCEGDKGLRLMDITKPTEPVYKQFFQEIPAYDVIVFDKHLLVTGIDGLLQYSFDDSDSLHLLSKIPVL